MSTRRYYPRLIALTTLERVLSGGYSNLALKEALRGVEKRDAAFVSALVYGALERLLTLDYIIERTAKGRLQPRIRNILRLAAYEHFYMSTPAQAVCNEYTNLAKATGKAALAGFVNGVLRNLTVSGDMEFEQGMEDAKALSLRHSWPEEIVSYFIECYGRDRTESMLAGWKQGGGVIRPNLLKIEAEALELRLGRRKIKFSPGKVNKNAMVLDELWDVESDEAFLCGMYAVQSEGSMTACELTRAKPGNVVIDACAAPGGKTAYIAQMMQNRGEIIAWDLHAHRLALVTRTCQRLGVTCVTAQVHDAAISVPELAERADAVLVDAPCSGLGVSGKPETRYRQDMEKIRGLAGLQLSILMTCADYVKKGGVLVYSTCTLGDIENTGVVKRFLEKRDDFEPDDITHAFVNPDANPIKDGCAQFMPDTEGEGFFVAGMRRK